MAGARLMPDASRPIYCPFVKLADFGFEQLVVEFDLLCCLVHVHCLALGRTTVCNPQLVRSLNYSSVDIMIH